MTTQIHIDTPVAAPHWALLEWQLVRAQTAAIREFYAKYFDERGYLRCVPRWGGDDGPDDAAEGPAPEESAPHSSGPPSRSTRGVARVSLRWQAAGLGRQ